MKKLIILAVVAGIFALRSCGEKTNAGDSNHRADEKPVAEFKSADKEKPTEPSTTSETPMVTFIELGSVNCIPCRQMQPIMKEIEEKYPEKVKVVFYDVWTKEGQPYATQYGIRVIPTQVFLDADGKEFFRHEGFFPLAEIEKLLKGIGVQ